MLDETAAGAGKLLSPAKAPAPHRHGSHKPARDHPTLTSVVPDLVSDPHGARLARTALSEDPLRVYSGDSHHHFLAYFNLQAKHERKLTETD